jgi:hypothetical protein
MRMAGAGIEPATFRCSDGTTCSSIIFALVTPESSCRTARLRSPGPTRWPHPGPISGHELTGRSLESPGPSQTCRSREIARSTHHGAFNTISAVALLFVHKCVHNLRTRVEDRIRDGKATGLANLHVAARITRGARQLRLRIDATWCWAIAIATAWHRFRAAFPRPADRPVPTTTKEPRPWKARPTRRHGQ